MLDTRTTSAPLQLPSHAFVADAAWTLAEAICLRYARSDPRTDSLQSTDDALREMAILVVVVTMMASICVFS